MKLVILPLTLAIFILSLTGCSGLDSRPRGEQVEEIAQQAFALVWEEDVVGNLYEGKQKDIVICEYYNNPKADFNEIMSYFINKTYEKLESSYPSEFTDLHITSVDVTKTVKQEIRSLC